MSIASRLTASIAAVGIAITGALVGPVSPAAAQTIKVCVKKKSGEMQLLKKKKCKKGWKKQSWESTGPQGAPGVPGPAGPQLSVKDKNGVVLGKFLGVSYTGVDYGVYVEINGGWYEYEGNGRLIPSNSVYYTDAACAGTGYLIDWSGDDYATWIAGVGGPTRVVDRVTSPTYGPARAFTVTTAVTPVAAVTPMYYLGSGGCSATTADPGDVLVALQPTTAPADAAGPLTIG